MELKTRRNQAEVNRNIIDKHPKDKRWEGKKLRDKRWEGKKLRDKRWGDNLLLMRMCSMDLKTRSMARGMFQLIWIGKLSWKKWEKYKWENNTWNNRRKTELDKKVILSKELNLWDQFICQKIMHMTLKMRKSIMLCKIKGTSTRRFKWRTILMCIPT